MIDLYWHYFLVQHGWRKKCPCKKNWQAVQTEKPLRTVCAGCFKCKTHYSIHDKEYVDNRINEILTENT